MKMTSVIATLACGLAHRTFPTLRERIAFAKKIFRRQASIAFELSIACIYVGIFLSVLLAISIMSYTAFYFWIIPEIKHEIPLHMQYNDCDDAVIHHEKVAAECFYPNAVVDFTSVDAAFNLPERYARRNRVGGSSDERVLMPGQKYAFSIRLKLPESAHNRNVGMFMISMATFSNHHPPGGNKSLTSPAGPTELIRSRRHAILKYKSTMRRIVENVARSPLYLFDWQEEAQQLKIPLVEAYYESHALPTSSVTVMINKSRIELYQSSIVIEAQLEGLKYWMYEHRISAAMVIIGFNFVLLSLITMASFITRAFGRGRSEPIKAVTSMPALAATSFAEKNNKLQKLQANSKLHATSNNKHRFHQQVSDFGRQQLDHHHHASDNNDDDYDNAAAIVAAAAAIDVTPIDKYNNNNDDHDDVVDNHDASPLHSSSSPRRIVEFDAALSTTTTTTRRRRHRDHRYADDTVAAADDHYDDESLDIVAPLVAAAAASTSSSRRRDAPGHQQQINGLAAILQASSSPRRTVSTSSYLNSNTDALAYGTDAEKRASVRAFLDELRNERVAFQRSKSTHAQLSPNHQATTNNRSVSGSNARNSHAAVTGYNRSVSDVNGLVRNRRTTAAADQQQPPSLGMLLGTSNFDEYATTVQTTSSSASSTMTRKNSSGGSRQQQQQTAVFMREENTVRRPAAAASVAAAAAVTAVGALQRQYSSASTSSSTSTASTVEYGVQHGAAVGEDDVDYAGHHHHHQNQQLHRRASFAERRAAKLSSSNNNGNGNGGSSNSRVVSSSSSSRRRRS